MAASCHLGFGFGSTANRRIRSAVPKKNPTLESNNLSQIYTFEVSKMTEV